MSKNQKSKDLKKTDKKITKVQPDEQKELKGGKASIRVGQVTVPPRYSGC